MQIKESTGQKETLMVGWLVDVVLFISHHNYCVAVANEKEYDLELRIAASVVI